MAPRPPVAVVFGTRPEAIKLAPVIRRLGPLVDVIHTGQHFNTEMAASVHRGLGLPGVATQLAVGGTRRGRQIGAAVQRLDEHFRTTQPRVVVVQGDTNTALAGALAANACDVPLVHVEAGLRSFDRDMPEEHNRVVIDHLADLLCAPTSIATQNLGKEGIPDERIVLTGNTIVDAVNELLPPAAERRAVVERHGVGSAGYVLATFHRPENVDDAAGLGELLHQLATVPIPVILPLHPRTAHRVATFHLDDRLARLQARSPMDYRDFLSLAAECALLVSDSGGVQEEASVLKRPVLVVRRSTERPEVLGTFATLVPRCRIGLEARGRLADLPRLHAALATLPCPFGDGRAAERIVGAVKAMLR